MLDSNCLYVQDENGNEKKMTILFTFDSEDKKKQYVVFSGCRSRYRRSVRPPVMTIREIYIRLKVKKSGKW